MTFENLTALYAYFDQLAEQDENDDLLFASSYVRSFIALNASLLGDESQALSSELARMVSENIIEAKNELSPQDQAIVNEYWQQIKLSFIH